MLTFTNLRRLRFADLQAMGLFSNWTTLATAIKHHGFPAGAMLTPNVRSWGELEIQEWVASRPVARKTVPKSPGRPRKSKPTEQTAC